jgi:predicted extracellular nuclease
LVAGQTDPQYAAYLVQGNDPSGINVGFLVNPNRVSNVSVTQYLATDTYSGSSLTFDRPPLLLTGIARNAGGAPLPITVIGNHLKALPDDDPTSFGATGTPEKRQAEAQKLAQLIQNLQAANPKIVLAVLGDLNSFEFNDGVNDMVGTLLGNTASAAQVIRPNTNVVSPQLTELSSALLPANQRQSYTESGNAQQLDHILVSSGAFSRVTRFAIAHLDADFRESLHYDYTRPERLSDHDAEVSYLSLPAATDATSSVRITISGLLLNRATQLYTGTVTLTNTSGATIGSPVQLFFNGLPSGVTLANATGSQGGVLPYITSTGALAPGASVAIPVQFQVAAGARVGYTNNVYTGTL